MNSPQLPAGPSRASRPRTRRRDPTCPRPRSTSSPRPATTSALALLHAAREADIVPYFRTVEGPARPVVEMEGAPRIMLGSNNYLGLTGDERVMQGARDALERYGTGLTGSRLLNGTTALHLAARGGDRRVDGHRGARSSSPPATRPTWARSGRSSAPGDTVVADSGDHASILDGCLLPPGQAARLPPQPHGQARAHARARGPTTAAACSSSSTASSRWRATSPPLPRGLRSVRALRRAADGRRGPRRRRARRARRRGDASYFGVEDRVDLRMGTFSKSLARCGGFLAGPADVIEFLRVQIRAFLFTASARARGGRRRHGRPAHRAQRRGPRAHGKGPGQRALLERRARRARLQGRAPRRRS